MLERGRSIVSYRYDVGVVVVLPNTQGPATGFCMSSG
jgi:hypothetical protein